MSIQSTKGAAKHFIVLSVAYTGLHGEPRSGELQRFEYIEGDRFKTQRSALRHADTARMRWRDNYAQFRDARFFITDTAEIEPDAFFNPMTKAGKSNKPLARLRHHVSGAIARGKGQAIVEVRARRSDVDLRDVFHICAHKVADEHANEMFSILASIGRL